MTEKEEIPKYESHHKFPGVKALKRFLPNFNINYQPPGFGTDADYKLTTPEARERFEREAIEHGKLIARAADSVDLFS